jgi:predicted alpha/beta-hydrolase family hydrolase
LKNPNRLQITVNGGVTTALVYTASAPRTDRALILAHGAGAGQSSPFMVGFAQALAGLGVDVVTFNFLYSEQRRRIPDRTPQLEACYRAVIDRVSEAVASATGGLFVGGKSMGGRIATQVAAEDANLRLGGLVLLGYPLHPPGKPNQRRDKHLAAIRRPMFFAQGSRDAFGTPAELAVALESLSPRPVVHVVSGGDHSFKIPKQTAQDQASVYANIQQTIVTWMLSVRRGRTSVP